MYNESYKLDPAYSGVVIVVKVWYSKVVRLPWAIYFFIDDLPNFLDNFLEL